MSERHRTDQARSRWWREPVLLAGAALILLQTIVRARIVLPSYYWADDFLHVGLVRRVGLTQEFLVRDHNGHLEIGANLVYWLIGRDAGLSFVPAAVSLAGHAAGGVLPDAEPCSGRSSAGRRGSCCRSPATCSRRWVSQQRRGGPRGLRSTAAADRDAHGDPGSRPRGPGTLLAVGGAVGGRARDGAALLGEGRPDPADAASPCWSSWNGRRNRSAGACDCSRPTGGVLVPHVLLLCVYVPFYLSVVDSSRALSSDAEPDLRDIGDTIFRLLLPGILGGPWTDAGAENTVFPYVGMRSPRSAGCSSWPSSG